MPRGRPSWRAPPTFRAALGDWRALVDDPAVDAVAIAVPPDLQPEVALRALDRGKPVFVEKPLAADLAGAKSVLERARAAGLPGMIDFNFPELATWQRAQAILAAGEIGRLRHVVVTWNVENQATRLRLKSWKTRGDNGGGLLGNFVSHCFYYLEWFCGPIAGLTGRIISVARHRRSGQQHRAGAGVCIRRRRQPADELRVVSRLRPSLEFYGEDGTLVLANPTADYFRGFELKVAQRSDRAFRRVDVADYEGDASSDSRIAAGVAAGAPLSGCVFGRRRQCARTWPRATACSS